MTPEEKQVTGNCHLVATAGSTCNNICNDINGTGRLCTVVMDDAFRGDKVTHQSEDEGEVGLICIGCEPQGGRVCFT